MIYKPVKGSTLNEKQAQRYGERIATLEEQYSGVTPAHVLQDAENKKSPLNEFFEWDDQIATRQHRIEQARYLIRNINVVVKQGDNEQEVRAFHSVKVKVIETNGSKPESETEQPGRGDRRFVSLQRAMSDDEWRQEVVDSAFKELGAWRQRYSVYRELAGVVEKVGKIIQEGVKVPAGKARLG